MHINTLLCHASNEFPTKRVVVQRGVFSCLGGAPAPVRRHSAARRHLTAPWTHNYLNVHLPKLALSSPSLCFVLFFCPVFVFVWKGLQNTRGVILPNNNLFVRSTLEHHFIELRLHSRLPLHKCFAQVLLVSRTGGDHKLPG